MGWLNLAMMLIPSIVQFVEQIHKKPNSGAAKLQAATNLTHVALQTAVASGVLTSTPTVQEVQSVVQGVVNAQNTAGQLQGSMLTQSMLAPQAPPIPLAPPAPQVNGPVPSADETPATPQSGTTVGFTAIPPTPTTDPVQVSQTNEVKQ